MKNNVYPCKPQFYYINVGVMGGAKLYRRVFVMVQNLLSVCLPLTRGLITLVSDNLAKGKFGVCILWLDCKQTDPKSLL